MGSRVETLKQRITEAFEGTRYPGHDRLVYDNSGYHLECNEVAALMRGKRWQGLDFDTIWNVRASLPFLTPEAFHYYCPGFMIWSLDAWDDFDDLSDSLLFLLTPPTGQKPGEEADADRFEQRVAQFNHEQKVAFRSFMETLDCEHGGERGLYEVAKALERYWGQV